MRRNGSVLVVVTAISAVVAVLGTSMLAVGYHARVRALRTVQDMAARVAADAGLTKAMHTLKSQYDAGVLNPLALPSETNTSLPNFEGVFTYTIALEASGRYTLTSTGTYQGAQRTVEAVMEQGNLVHEYALFALESLVLRNSARIDWYNNESGDAPLIIGTNSTNSGAITMYSSSYINGDVVVGAGGDPAQVINNGGGLYTGSAYAQPENRVPPPVVVPAALVSAPSSGNINNNRTISTSGKYSKIDLGNGEKLTINGDVELYITGKVSLGNSAEIQINEGGSLVLYVDGDIVGDNSSRFNNMTNDPRRLRIFGTNDCSKVELKNSGDMYAVVYAPAAAVTIDNSATLWGSLTSRTCELKSSGVMYYDASLREYQDPALVGTLELTSWREY
jgi:hypothetical protein